MFSVFARLLLAATTSIVASASAAEPVPSDVVKATVDAAGGEAKLLRLFRMKDAVALGDDPDQKGSERTAILEPPHHWWQGKRDRVTEDKEPATYLVWAWTLSPLVDSASKLETAPEIDHDGRPAYGIRISETISPPMTCYFDRETRRLVRIDWRSDKHVFSDWREIDGFIYPARCVGYKLKDNKRWYHTEILAIERLQELPPGLSR